MTEEASDSHQLEIVTRIISQLMTDYSRTPTFQVAAPYITLLELWLDGETSRRKRIERENSLPGNDL